MRCMITDKNIKRFRFNNADILQLHFVDVVCWLSFLLAVSATVILLFVYPPVSTVYYGEHPTDGYIISGNINPIVDAQRRWSAASACATLNVSCVTISVAPVNDPRVWTCLTNMSILEQNRCGRHAAHQTALRAISQRTTDEHVSVFDDFIQLNANVEANVNANVEANVNLPIQHYGGQDGYDSSAYMIRPSEALHLVSIRENPVVNMSRTIGRDTLCPNEHERGVICTY